MLYRGGIFMALINCPQCGKEISDKASFCPQCGFELTNANSEKTVDALLQKKIVLLQMKKFCHNK